MTNVFNMCGELDPRSGTIWLSPQLYPTRKALYEDWQLHLKIVLGALDPPIDPDSIEGQGPAASTFYVVGSFLVFERKLDHFPQHLGLKHNA